jgi:hypothetical protein
MRLSVVVSGNGGDLQGCLLNALTRGTALRASRAVAMTCLRWEATEQTLAEMVVSAPVLGATCMGHCPIVVDVELSGVTNRRVSADQAEATMAKMLDAMAKAVSEIVAQRIGGGKVHVRATVQIVAAPCGAGSPRHHTYTSVLVVNGPGQDLYE